MCLFKNTHAHVDNLSKGSRFLFTIKATVELNVNLVYLSGFSSGNVLDFEEYVTLDRVSVQFLVTVASALLHKRRGL